MSKLETCLGDRARDGLISTEAQLECAALHGVGLAEVDAAALELGLCPARYQRNRSTISGAGQLTLLRSCVAVIGCGGLGGYVIEELARLGVGRIIAIDPDLFEEHNLTRQILATLANLGEPKVTAAATRVAAINPAVSVTAVKDWFSRNNGAGLLAGATVVVDTLDNIATRLDLVAICRDLGVPLVHGAIGGWYGQVATQLPGGDISPYVGGGQDLPRGVEVKLGNPSFTPAVIASLQVAEACKIILEEGKPLAEGMLLVDLLEMELEEVRL